MLIDLAMGEVKLLKLPSVPAGNAKTATVHVT